MTAHEYHRAPEQITVGRDVSSSAPRSIQPSVTTVSFDELYWIHLGGLALMSRHGMMLGSPESLPFRRLRARLTGHNLVLIHHGLVITIQP